MDQWGIKVIAHDVFMPQRRERKQQIPYRNGMYDYGSKYFEERELTLDCLLTRQIRKAEFREIIYELSRKRSIYLWNEPDKYYVGQLYEPAEVIEFPAEIMREFSLVFLCEPFAYGQQAQVISLARGENPIVYGGTAETPCLIRIKNNLPFDVYEVYLTILRRGSD
jgi:phage-related protein